MSAGKPAAGRRVVGKRVAVKTVSFGRAQEPRLRFDRTAVGLVRRLQSALGESVPQGRTVVVTITAPIRQDSKTGIALQDRIRKLLAARRAQLDTTLYGNRIRVRVLKGGGARTSRLIGFVHNPEPSPAALFDVTRVVLERMGSAQRPPQRDRWLVVADPEGHAPIETLRQVCLALGAWTVFKRIVVEGHDGVRALQRSTSRH